MSVHIEWVGHACFRVWRDGGPVIVMDPFTPKNLGLSDKEASLEGDTVIVSSLTDRAHGYPGLVRGDPPVINALEVAEQQSVRIAVYDALGREVITLYDGTVTAGTEHAFTIDGGGLPSGIYVVRATGEQFTDALSVTLLK